MYKKARYYWNNGNIVALEVRENKIVANEYLYMHLQMRKMRLKEEIFNANVIQILPDRFGIVKEIPKSIKDIKLITIKCPYLYWIDVYLKKIERKLKR